MDQLQLRWARLDDAFDVANVHVDSWRAAYRGLIDQDVLDALDVEQRADGWRRWIDRSLSAVPTDAGTTVAHRLLVAVSDDRIVGWAGFGAGRDEGTEHQGELAGLYVHPDHWSHRVGHLLLTRVEQELRDEHSDAYLWVLQGNERAISFYERHGWTADGTERIETLGDARELRESRHIRRLG